MSNETYEERLNEFVLALSSAENIEKIAASLATEQGISLSICIPKENKSGVKPAKKSINLLVESKDKIGFFKLARLISPLKGIIGFDYAEDDSEDRVNIIRQHLKDPANLKVDEKFSEIVQFSQSNIDKIQRLLAKNYPEAFKNEDDFKRLGEKSFDQNFSSEEDDGNLLDFVVGLMSCASRRGIDASRLLREAESKLSQLRVTTSPGANKK